MGDIKIHTQIQSRHYILDGSGKLPCSIVFRLCRRSDEDPRPLLLSVAGSALDVPYALGHGLLAMRERSLDDVHDWTEVDLSPLSSVEPTGEKCLSLPSPVGRTEHWKQYWTVYHCHIDTSDAFLSLLKPGRRYQIRLAGRDLGVKRWEYAEQTHFIDKTEPPRGHDGESLITLKPTAGSASFTFEECLVWPPAMTTSLRGRRDPPPSGSAVTNDEPRLTLEISILNTGSQAVTVQTQGRQRYLLYPWDTESLMNDNRNSGQIRILDGMAHTKPGAVFQVVSSETGEVVRGGQPRSVCGLIDSTADLRPKEDDLLVMEPGSVVTREVDVATLVKGLDDGRYKLSLRPKGCRWWRGNVLQEVEDDGRLPKSLCTPMILPLRLESSDEIELDISNGKPSWCY